jgi:hypothetical protein
MNAAELTFGVEIETSFPVSESVIVGGYHNGAQVAWLPAGWNAQADGSIRSDAGYRGVEFVSPVLKGAEGIRQVLEVLRILREKGAKVNQSTGLHVHVGFDKSNQPAVDKLVNLVANFEKAIYASTGTKSRETGNYCGSIRRHGDAANATRQARCNRYHVLNLATTRPTIEFRAFAGTLSDTKLVGYIQLCLGLVERALKMNHSTKFTAKTPVESSPIARSGEGQTALNRLFYQLGWTKGRTNYEFGIVDSTISVKAIKAELMRLAQKYDARA